MRESFAQRGRDYSTGDRGFSNNRKEDFIQGKGNAKEIVPCVGGTTETKGGFYCVLLVMHRHLKVKGQLSVRKLSCRLYMLFFIFADLGGIFVFLSVWVH